MLTFGFTVVGSVGFVGFVGSIEFTGVEVLLEPPPHPVRMKVPVIERINSRTIFFFIVIIFWCLFEKV